MNKQCAKCRKTVYPTEELKCLDKTWHKACFKCEACGMTLNMKNYKGYDKLPYCNAHYPSTKHTVVADTPEARRIAENTKIQSNIQYHADFERQKGHKTSVADDPETARIKANTAIQSNINYWGVRETREQMEHKRPNEMVEDVTRRSRNPGKISDYDPAADDQHNFASPYSQRNSANVVYDSQRGEGDHRSSSHRNSQQTRAGYQQPFSYGGGGPPPSHLHGNNPSRTSYHDDGAARGQSRSSYGEAQQAPYGGRDSYSESRNSYGENRNSYGENRNSHADNRSSYGDHQAHRGNGHGDGYRQQQGFSYTGAPQAGGQSGYGGDPRASYTEPTAYQAPPPEPQPYRAPQPPPPKQPLYQAIYDYVAADDDEVSFNEGDIIMNTNIIDAGWMTGTVQRTGQAGMLPSNYVEKVN